MQIKLVGLSKKIGGLVLFVFFLNNPFAQALTIDQVANLPAIEQNDYVVGALMEPNPSSSKVVDNFVKSVERDLANSQTQIAVLKYLAKAYNLVELSQLSSTGLSKALADKIIPYLKSNSAEVRLNAVKAIGVLGEAGHGLKVAELCYDSELSVKTVAIDSLSKFKNYELIYVLSDILSKEKDTTVIASLVRSIGKFRTYNKEAADLIAAHLKTKNAALQEEVFQALGDMKAEEYAKAILDTKPIVGPGHMLAPAFRIDALTALGLPLPISELRSVLQLGDGAKMRVSSALEMVEKFKMVELRPLVEKIAKTSSDAVLRDVARDVLKALL